MSAEPSGSERELELAHVLFIDVVGYSKRLVDEQRETLAELNASVRQTEQYRKADAQQKLICLPTGDGMAMAFFTNPEAPVRCAIEIARAVLNHPEIQLRMGVHTGPVNTIEDVNERANVAGAGINMAQRVMDCGDAGHILLSQRVAEDLRQSREWSPLLHDLGECEVKHGVRLHLFNLHDTSFGNTAVPTRVKLGRQSQKKRSWPIPIGIGALALLVLGIVSYQLIRSKTRQPSVTAAPEKSIAVLPFENLSEVKSNAYFAEGIQDEILTRLANLRELKVISRTSTAKYQSHPDNLKTIAAELGVANILEGSVQRLGNDVHINAQLIKASTDEHLWAQSFDRTMEHAFAVEGEVAQKVANALKITLAPAQVANLNKPLTENAQAYDLFLKGEYEQHRAWSEADQNSEIATKAASYYEEAARLDPEFVVAIASLARAELSQYYLYTAIHGADGAPEVSERAKANIDRALRLAPDLAIAHLALGEWYLWIKHDHPSAIAELQRAIELDPHLTEALIRLSSVWRRENQPEKAIAELQTALKFDPRNIFLHRNLGIAYAMPRQYKLCAESYARAIALEHTDTIDLLNLAGTYVQSGDIEAGRRTLDSFPVDRRDDAGFGHTKRYILRLEHDFHGMAELLRETPETALPQWKRLFREGDIARGLGQSEIARDRFERARSLVAEMALKNNNDAGLQFNLAYLDASLHRAQEAIAEANRGVALARQANDLSEVSGALVELATTNSLLGRTDEAIDILQRIFALPSGEYISVTDLKLDPDWDPLRHDPRFQKLVASLAPKETK